MRELQLYPVINLSRRFPCKPRGSNSFAACGVKRKKADGSFTSKMKAVRRGVHHQRSNLLPNQERNKTSNLLSTSFEMCCAYQASRSYARSVLGYNAEQNPDGPNWARPQRVFPSFG